MELYTLEQIALDNATEALLSDVDEAALKVNELRPLGPEVVERIVHELLGERVYSSNAIEGNTYTKRETIHVLNTGYVDIARKREATEVINLGNVIKHVHGELLGKEQPHNLDELLGVHKMLLSGINDEWAGRFREVGVLIQGAKHQPPDHRYVHDMADRFLERLSSENDAHPVVQAVWAHWTIARIHPFHDGNGRIARVWQDLILFRNRLTCAIIRPEDRDEYLFTLQAGDEGNFNPLTQLVAQRVSATFDKYLSAQLEDKQVGAWATELVGETDARARERRTLSYLRWSRKMEQVRYEFERCASRVTHLAENVEIQLRSYEMIDQSKWENIRSGAGAMQTWLFRLVFRRGRERLTYFFFFGKHFWCDADTELDRSEPRVSLLISEAVGNEPAKRLGEEGFNTPLSIREVFVVDNQLVRRRFDAEKNTDVYDRGIDPVTIAQDFIREVLLIRMT